jgi:16S rRNA (adenine1518-N6/adenine1519-N6)-dimethyltransferase
VSETRLLTPATVRALLAEHGLRPRRSLGQHFLADPNTARRIVRLAGVEPGDRVLEIGPGVGSLTLALADAGADVVALELDRGLLDVLADVVGNRAHLVSGDATTADFEGLLAEAFGVDAGLGHHRSSTRSGRILAAAAPQDQTTKGVRCVSNLPYNIATPVVARILDTAPRIEHLLVMVQREVGRRLVAGPGTKDYGAVSVKVAYHATAEIVGSVPPTVFVPRPKVDSALVRLTRRPEPLVDVASPERLFTLARAGFAHRRKTLRRALADVIGAETTSVLERAGIDPGARAETLGVQEWAALARAAP